MMDSDKMYSDPERVMEDLISSYKNNDEVGVDRALSMLVERRRQIKRDALYSTPEWVRDIRSWLSAEGNKRSIKDGETITITVAQFRQLL